MSKKQEALNKAKESWRIIVEWWKELWEWAVDVVWWTTWALGYTLLSWWEKVAAQISESRENNEWISYQEKENRKRSTVKLNKKAKTHIDRAWKLGITAVKWVWKVSKWWAKVIWHTVKWSYHLIDAWDKAIGEKISEKRKEKWERSVSKLRNFLRNNILKLLIAGSVLWYGWTEISKSHKEGTGNDTFVEYFWKDDKLFVVDVSGNNNFNAEKFEKWNKERWKSRKHDVRWVSGMYVRVQCEKWEDPKFKTFYDGIKEYNKTAKPGEKIAIWWYIYFDKHDSAMTAEWIEKQVDSAIRTLWILNKEDDWVVDLVPMLDFEFYSDPWVNSEQWSKCKEAVFKWLQLFEEKTWIIPWIYTWGSLYHDYFLNDARFKKYPVWIASYSSDRVNQSPDWHSVLIWPRWNPVEFQPNLVQFTEEIGNSWIWNAKDRLDWDTTTRDKFEELIIRNPDAPQGIKANESSYRAREVSYKARENKKNSWLKGSRRKIV